MISASGRPPRVVLSAWRALGWGGRIAVVGAIAAVVVAVTLAVEIPAAAQHHLLDGRVEALESVTQAVVAELVLPTSSHDAGNFEAFDQAIRSRVLGGDTIGVKVWSRSGEIVYATSPALIGEVLDVPQSARRAFEGSHAYTVVDADDVSHPTTEVRGRVVEFFYPIHDADGVVGVFEVEQTSSTLDATVSDIRRTVWVWTALGLGLLTLILTSTVLAGARAEGRRMRRTERLLGQAIEAQEMERKRIVASLHGDVGQRLYRVLYGLEGAHSKMKKDQQRTEVMAELVHLTDLVKSIDATLRSEMRMLHRDVVDEVGFTAALIDLAETTRLETGLDVSIAREYTEEPARAIGGTLLWAIEEGVINARKHADATRVDIRARHADGVFEVEVRDDGVGKTRADGIGLTTVTERVAAAGGGLTTAALRGSGTLLRAWIPTEEGLP